MDYNKNTSSKLEELFENARKQEPVMNLNEVSEVLKNPPAFQKKKESNSYFWFGTFLLVGLVAFGTFYFYKSDTRAEDKSDNALTVTTVTPSNSNTAPQKAPANKPNEIAASGNSTNAVSPAENSSNENKGVKNSAVPKEVAPAKLGKTPSPAIEPSSKPGPSSTHYEGISTISFLSDDNKKIKMVVTSLNEVQELKINDETISNDNYSSYKNIIDEGLKLKKAKGGSESANNAASSEKQNIMNAMLKQLTADGLVSSSGSFDFTLTGKEVILNSEKQSQETFDKCKQVYEKVTGEKLPAKYNLHIKR
jgi:hypothetical protein